MRIGHLLVLICLGSCLIDTARAQDLVPHAYAISVVDSDAIVVNYSHLEGGVQLNGAIPITGALDFDWLSDLAQRLQRRTQFTLTVSEQHLYLSLGEETLSAVVTRIPLDQ